MTTLSLNPESRSTDVKDLKTELFAAASDAFPDGEVTVKKLDAGHAKLTHRKLPPSYQVRVVLTANTVEYKSVVVREDGKDIPKLERLQKKEQYAVSGMYPQDGGSSIKAFIAELKSDAVRFEEGFPK